MNGTDRRAWAFGGLLLVAACGPGRAATVDDIRVLGVYSNCFDFMLASVAGQRAGQPCFALNDLRGQTHMAAVGGRVGDYTVVSAFVTTNRVFAPSVNAFLNQKSAEVTLANDADERVVLPMGAWVPRPGWMALLADLGSGATRIVREGDGVAFSPPLGRMAAITPQSVTLLTPAGEVALQAPAEAENAHLAALWNPEPEVDPFGAPDPIPARRAQANVAREQPRRRALPHRQTGIAQLTFNPLESTHLAGWREYPITAYGPFGPNGQWSARQVGAIPVPMFRSISYRGSVMVRMR